MNRDNLLFTVLGILAGFIVGYLAHESMSEKQPARRIAGASASMPAPSAGMANPMTPAPDSTQAMEEVRQLRAYVESNPEDTEALRLLANMNYDIGGWDQAASLYERYLELKPDDVDVLTDLGACYRNLKRPEDALDVFRRARDSSPAHWQSRYNEVLVLAFDLGRLDEAGAAMQELAELQPENPEVERLAAEIERRASGG